MKIVTAGDNCMDVYVDTDKVYPGGNPVNVAVYCKRYCADVSYIGVVGSDENGERIVSALADKGVDVSHVRKMPGVTAKTLVKMIRHERTFLSYEEGVLSDFKLSDSDITFIGTQDLLVSGIWGKIEKQLPEIKKRYPRVRIAFDFADKETSPSIWETLQSVDYAFFSWKDTENEAAMKSFMRKVFNTSVKVVVVTLGKKGSIAYDGVDYYQYGIIPCEVTDTMGAGDSYIAGFLCAILEDRRIVDCMKQGTESSTIVIQYPGAW